MNRYQLRVCPEAVVDELDVVLVYDVLVTDDVLNVCDHAHCVIYLAVKELVVLGYGAFTLQVRGRGARAL